MKKSMKYGEKSTVSFNENCCNKLRFLDIGNNGYKNLNCFIKVYEGCFKS